MANLKRTPITPAGKERGPKANVMATAQTVDPIVDRMNTLFPDGVNDLTVVDDLTVGDDLTVTGDASITSTLTVTGAVAFNATTASTTKDTGGLVTQGGVGVEKEIYAGLSINAGTYLTSGNGTVALPAIGPVSDPDSGVYQIGDNNQGWACAGAKVLDIGTTGLGVTGVLTSTGVMTATGGHAAPGGNFTASPRNFAIGGLVPAVSTDFTDATPVNTETYIGEVFVPVNCTVTGIAIFNGSNVTDNIIVALADASGAVVAQSVSTAGSGADSYQRVPFTGTYAAKGPATYYILSQYAGGTSRYNAPPLGSFGASKKTGEVFGTFTTITPPTTFTANLCNIASLY